MYIWEFLMQSFCIEERGTDKNCSGTGLKRGVEMLSAKFPAGAAGNWDALDTTGLLQLR